MSDNFNVDISLCNNNYKIITTYLSIQSHFPVTSDINIICIYKNCSKNFYIKYDVNKISMLSRYLTNYIPYNSYILITIKNKNIKNINDIFFKSFKININNIVSNGIFIILSKNKNNIFENLVTRSLSILNLSISLKLYEINTSQKLVYCILDEFTYYAFEPECKLIPLDIKKWKTQILKNPPDLFLCESVWQSYINKINLGSFNQKEKKENIMLLIKVIYFLKMLNIPSVFWNKEDPSNYIRFIDYAKLFDYIFTTDVDCIKKYKKDTLCKNINVLLFGIQPLIHNPINRLNNKLVFFAGAWYNNFNERKNKMNMILNIPDRFCLDIFDRNFTSVRKSNFPKKFHKNIKHKINYLDILKKFKEYKIMLNVNTVEHSDTMFSRRIYEALACKISVISTFSKGLVTNFSDSLYIVNSSDETTCIIDMINNNSTDNELKSHIGYRKVMMNNTYKDRFDTILDKIGIVSHNKEQIIYVFCLIKNKDNIINLLKCYKQQTFVNKKLYIISDDIYDISNEYNYMNYVQFISFVTEKSNVYYVYFDENNEYGNNYLLDIIIPFKFTRAKIIGKSSYYIKNSDKIYILVGPDRENIYTPFILQDTMAFNIFSTTQLILFLTKGFDDLIKTLKPLDIYSSDKYNFIKNN